MIHAPKIRSFALAAAAAISLAGALALGQQPPLGPPGQMVPPQQMQPRQPQRPGLPSGHPTMPGMPGMIPGGGQQRGGPLQIGPDGRPVRRPGRPSQAGQPGQPGGPARPRPRPRAEEAEEEGGEHECPGQGPDDRPPPLNYWHGMLMVNNELAQKPGFLNQLLFRYENTKNPCDPKNEPAPYLASLINFGILALILFRFGKKPLAEALLTRKKTIMADIETATRLKEDAEERLDDYQDKIENIETRLAEVRAQYAADAEVEKKHILAEAEERRVRMRRDAEFRVEQERKAVREQLLREAVIEATAAAEALIAKQVSSADQDRMATQYLAAIGAALAATPRAATGATGAS